MCFLPKSGNVRSWEIYLAGCILLIPTWPGTKSLTLLKSGEIYLPVLVLCRYDTQGLIILTPMYLAISLPIPTYVGRVLPKTGNIRYHPLQIRREGFY